MSYVYSFLCAPGCYYCGSPMIDDEDDDGMYCSKRCHNLTDQAVDNLRRPMFEYKKSD